MLFLFVPRFCKVKSAEQSQIQSMKTVQIFQSSRGIIKIIILVGRVGLVRVVLVKVVVLIECYHGL